MTSEADTLQTPTLYQTSQCKLSFNSSQWVLHVLAEKRTQHCFSATQAFWLKPVVCVPLFSILYLVIHNKSYTNFILYTSDTVWDGGGGSAPKLRVCKKKIKLYHFFFLVWAVKHKLVSMRFRNIIKRRKSCQKRVNNTYIIVRVRTKATELVIFVVAHIRL